MAMLPCVYSSPLGYGVNNYLYLFSRDKPYGLIILSTVTTAPGEGGTDLGDSEKAQEKIESIYFLGSCGGHLSQLVKTPRKLTRWVNKPMFYPSKTDPMGYF
jgi:hypothetical protein